ncbi:PKD domain-containing protein [Halorarum salinum]|uniref:PKD domain-containing protein n=1 Tax=Halorarum salinum TaxID=2743089 RepID=A0A7D5LEW5_9EURY|nr:PKD domain-containing protein [Halobaculum salinum]QLG64315.1 PKD domain-containing protein [Halobaculum salinum]
MFGNAAGERTTALALALVVLASAVTAVPGLVLLAPPAAADTPSTVAVAQGSNCYTVTPVVDESQTVEEFYDYRNPETDPSGDYSSYGTDEYQEPRSSSMFFYTGSEGTSLVVVHGQRGDQGNGSTVSWDVSGLPSDWDLAVQDDEYENDTQDDNFDTGDTTADIDWMYNNLRNDGAAFRGLESEEFDTITIEPRYNEEADAWGDWFYSGSDQYHVESWTLMEEGGETVGELALDQEVTITAGPCPGDELTADIDAPGTPAAGEEVTFDASGSTPEDRIVEYRWDLGDGTNATGESVDHAYDEPGNYTVSLTVEDAAGETNSTSTEVTVTEATNAPPTASLSVPPNATVNESVQLDAGGSTDDEGIVEYRWDFDDDGTVDRGTDSPETRYAFDSVGEATVNLTVVDTANATDSTTATLTVEERTNEPPTADLSAPSNGTVGEDVRFDASGSSDDVGVEEYRWDFDDDGTVDRTINASVVQHPFDAAGEFTANVTVVDAEGATDSDTATVTVSESAALSAVIDASTTEATPGDVISFDGGASTPADGITDYRWEFGDGENGTGVTAEHAYEDPGTYTVTLRVNGTDNATATAEMEVTVAEDGGGDGGDGGNGGNDGDDDNGDNSSPPPSSGGGGGGGGAPPAPDPEPSFELGGVNATNGELLAGEEAEFSIRVENVGDAAGTREVEFAVDGTTTAGRSVDLAPGEAETVTFTHRFAEAGTHTVELGGAEPTEVRVLPAEPDLSVTDVSLADDTVTTEEDVRIDATVRNDGYVEGSMELELVLFDEVVAVESVSVPRGEARTVTFTRRVSAPGTYTASVAGRNVTVEVVGTDGAPTRGEDRTSETAAPGFTPLATLLALLSLVACAVVRSRGGR